MGSFDAFVDDKEVGEGWAEPDELELVVGVEVVEVLEFRTVADDIGVEGATEDTDEILLGVSMGLGTVTDFWGEALSESASELCKWKHTLHFFLLKA